MSARLKFSDLSPRDKRDLDTYYVPGPMYDDAYEVAKSLHREVNRLKRKLAKEARK